MIDKPKILLTQQINGKNGGPYVSHQRIIESELNEKYDLKPLMVPRQRQLINPFGMLNFVKAIMAEKPQAVQITGLQTEGFLLTIACMLARTKRILAIHGSSTQALNIGRLQKAIVAKIEEFTVQQANIVFGVSDYVSGWKISNSSKKFFGTIYNLPNGSPQTLNYASNFRQELGINSDDILIVSTGRITREKGYDVLLRTIKKIGLLSNVYYVIAGDGEYKAEFEREVRQYGYDSHVFLLGYRKDIDNILSASDAFIICTKHETLCISLLEAALHSLPLIATNIGGIPEIIVDGRNGFLVENEDVYSFSEALTKLIFNPELRIKMGKIAYEDISSKFDNKVTLSRLDDLYRTVIDT